MDTLRRVVAVLLVIAATVVAPGFVGARWLHDRVQDQDGYVDLVAPLADDAGVRRVLADATADAAVRTAESAVGVQVPAALRDLAREAARAVTASPTFPEFWRQANEDLHRQIFSVLDDGADPAREFLTVDARPLLAQALLLLSEQGVPVINIEVPPLPVPVVRASVVAERSADYQRASDAMTWVVVLWLALALLAVVIAVGWRGRARVGGTALLGVALGAFLLSLASGPASDVIVDDAGLDSRGLARVLADRVVDSLGTYADRWALVAGVLGVVLVLAAFAPRRRRASPGEAPYDGAGTAPAPG